MSRKPAISINKAEWPRCSYLLHAIESRWYTFK